MKSRYLFFIELVVILVGLLALVGYSAVISYAFVSPTTVLEVIKGVGGAK